MAPVAMLWFKRNLIDMRKQEEIIQFQSLMLILMHMDGMTVETILEWMERFAYCFKEDIAECRVSLCHGEKEALIALRDSQRYELFRDFVENLLSIDRVGVVAAFDEIKNDGIVKFLVCRVLGSEALITIVINAEKLKHVENFAQMLKNEGIEFGLNVNINKTNNNVILSDKFVHVCGKKELQGQENGISYPISSLSFMQVNDYIKTKIYNKALHSIDKGSIVVDAYSGAGLMSAMLAQKAKRVYGIEIVETATKNANKLAELNKISNLVNINGDCEQKLPELVDELRGEFVQVVLDPPRKGCDKRVLEAVVISNPEKVIYISCNPATLARDAKVLIDAGYSVKEVTGFNMFPQTSHVETVAIFQKESK